MAEPFTISLVGDAALLRKLERLATRDIKWALRRATRAGAKMIRPTAQRLAPKRTGRLRKAIRVRATRRSRRYIGAVVTLRDGWFKGETFYGGFQEWGWRTGKRGGPRGRRIPGKHFMERAAEQAGPAAAAAAVARIRIEIEAAARR